MERTWGYGQLHLVRLVLFFLVGYYHQTSAPETVIFGPLCIQKKEKTAFREEFEVSLLDLSQKGTKLPLQMPNFHVTDIAA